MTIQLSPRIERIVIDAIHSGQYRSAEEVLSEAIAVWQAEKATGVFRTQAEAIKAIKGASGERRDEEREAAIERLKSFGKTHGLSLGDMTIKQLRDEARP